MASGSCLCGDIKLSYTGEAADSVLCWCRDCRKISGGTGSINFLIPGDQFKLDAGSPLVYTKTTDTDHKMNNFTCGKCGTTLWREGTKYPGVKLLKAGVLDGDIMTETKPSTELFASTRPGFIQALPDAKQLDGTL